MKYEYMVVSDTPFMGDHFETGPLERRLNKFGERGWRIIHVDTVGVQKIYIYERPVKKPWWKRLFGK